MPSRGQLLADATAAGESLPRVKPCAKTPQPRTAPSGRSTSPASRGPLELGNQTRSTTRNIVAESGLACCADDVDSDRAGRGAASPLLEPGPGR